MTGTPSTHPIFWEWVRNNAITISMIVGGFVFTLYQLRGDLSIQSNQIGDLKTNLSSLQISINAVQQTQQADAITKEDLVNQINMNKTDVQTVNKRLDEQVGRVNNIESTLRTIDTNQALINQQIQFLSTSKSFIDNPTPGPSATRRGH